MDRDRIISAEIPPGRQLLRIAWPLVIAGKLDYLVGFTVHAWMGQLVGLAGLALLGVLQPFLLVVVWLVLIVPKGVASMVAREIGAGTRNAIDLIASGAVLQVLMSCAIVLIGIVGLWLGAEQIADGIEPTRTEVFWYGAWYLLALPLFGLAMLLLFAIFATGNTRAGMWRSLAGLLTLSLSVPLCIDTFEMGILGPAVAEALFNLVILAALSFVVIRWGRTLELGEYSNGFRQRQRWGAMLSIGGPAQFSRVFQHCTLIYLAQVAAEDGSVAVGGYGISFMILLLGAQFTMGWARAAAIAFGQNYGARQPQRALAFLRVSVVGSLAIGAFFFAVASFPRPLIRLFSSDPAMVESAAQTMSIVRWALVPIALWQLWLALFEAVGRTIRAASIYMISDLAGVGCAILMADGVDTAAWALVIANSLKGILLVGLLPSRLIGPTRALDDDRLTDCTDVE